PPRQIDRDRPRAVAGGETASSATGGAAERRIDPDPAPGRKPQEVPTMLRSVDLDTALVPKQPMATNGRKHLRSAPQRSLLDERLDLLTARYRDAVAAGNYCYQRVIERQDGAWVTVGGHRLLMLASYGYLGLLGHPRIAAASQEAAATLGTGSHGVP